jgi:hypothetical protein
VLYACHVPPTGLVYRIKGPDLPPACLSEDHVEFSWRDGSVPGLSQPLVLAASKGGPEGTVQSLNDLMGKLELRGAGVTTDDEEVITITTPDGTSLSAPEGGPTDALVVAGDGSVGVGTGTPEATLDVAGDIQATSISLGNTIDIDGVANTITTGTDEDLAVLPGGTGKVGIGTSTPDELLSVAGTIESTTGGFKFPDGTTMTGGGIAASGVTTTTDGFAVTGTFGAGTIPVEGPGARMMWYPRKAAFRAGRLFPGVPVCGLGVLCETAWDDANVGQISVAFGFITTASGPRSTAMGSGTTASGIASTTMGAITRASGEASTAMGNSTTASGLASTAMGSATTASGEASTALGQFTEAIGNASTAMGEQTTASGLISTAMGSETTASGAWSTAAGYGTTASADLSTAIGDRTTASGDRSTAMGNQSRAIGEASTALGHFTEAIGLASTAMGNATTARGGRSTAMGNLTEATASSSTAMGSQTTASGLASTAMGNETTASGAWSTAMGNTTTASGEASTALGQEAEASGETSTAMGFWTRATAFASTAMGGATTASGTGSTAMGGSTIADGNFTTAMGRFASTNGHAGSFVYGDNSTAGTPSYVQATAPNSFVLRAQRLWFGKSGDQVATAGRYIETSTGAYLSDGGAWTNASDRNKKENFGTEDGESVLARIAGLPIQSWNYRAEDPDVRHLGPTSQDFYAAFGFGDSDKAIATVDIDGVNMLAVQALERRTRELQVQLDANHEEIAELRAELAVLLQRLERLEGTR